MDLFDDASDEEEDEQNRPDSCGVLQFHAGCGEAALKAKLQNT